jgi:hypothetical protein
MTSIDDGNASSGTASAERAAVGCKPPVDDRMNNLPEISVRTDRAMRAATPQ